MKNISFFLIFCILVGCHSEQYLTNRALNDINANKENLEKVVQYLLEKKINSAKVKDIGDVSSMEVLSKMRITYVQITYISDPSGKHSSMDSTIRFRRHVSISGSYIEEIWYYFGKNPRKLIPEFDIDDRISYLCYKPKELNID